LESRNHGLSERPLRTIRSVARKEIETKGKGICSSKWRVV
jgi:hypothetical protein